MCTRIWCVRPVKKVAFEQAVAVVVAIGLEALKHLEGRDRPFCIGSIAHGHARAIGHMSGDGRIDHARVMTQGTMNEREVTSVDVARTYAILQTGSRQVGLGREHEAARVAVEPMHDARPVLALHLSQVADAAMAAITRVSP